MTPNKQLKIRTGIDLTAMVDVVLLIVIFFLITSSFEKLSAIDVDLPTSSTSEQVADDGIVVSITSQGMVYLGKRLLENDELSIALQEILSSQADAQSTPPPITVRGDRLVSYEKIIEVLDIVKNSGATQISLEVR